jgi:hypothetical protein
MLLRSCMTRSVTVADAPKRHAGLGLDAYVQVCRFSVLCLLKLSAGFSSCSDMVVFYIRERFQTSGALVTRYAYAQSKEILCV